MNGMQGASLRDERDVPNPAAWAWANPAN